MNALIENLNPWGEHALAFAWPMFWQSSLLIVLVLAIDFVLRRRVRAGIRYALWLVVLTKLLLPPSLAFPTGAAWWIRGRPLVEPSPTPHNYRYIVTYGESAGNDSLSSVQSLAPPPPKLSVEGWLLTSWSLGSIALFGLLLLRWRQAALQTRQTEAAPPALDELIRGLQNEVKYRRSVRVRLVNRAMSPAVCGFFRPTILLPRMLVENLEPAQLRAVLLHELIHLRRGDVWVNCAQALVQIFYWWHPLVWLANARIRRVREEAVDDAVMMQLANQSDIYAPTLLEVAKMALDRSLVSLGLVGILESRNALRQRIERLLDFTAPRRAGLSVVSLVTLAAFAAVAVPMGKPPPVARDSIVLSQRDNSDLTNTVPDVTKGEASNLATSTESAITELKTKFRGADVQTRRKALRIFAFSPCVVPESANPSLREALPILIQAAKDEDPLIRHYAAIALWKLRSPDEMVIETLGNLVVVETDLETANVAAAALKEVGPSAAPAVANLIRALECRKDDGTFIPGSGNQIEPNISLGTGLRRCVIEALGNIGPAAQSAVPALHKLLHDTREFSHGSQVFSAKALWQITGKN